jgi:hypothetical protein
MGEAFLLAGDDSWVLPFLMSPDLRISPLSEASLRTRLVDDAIQGRSAALLVLNRPDFRTRNLPIVRTCDFPEELATALYEAGSESDRRSKDLTTRVSAEYNKGWIGDRAIIQVYDWRRPQIALELWNPSQRHCTAQVDTSTDQSETALVPNERKVILLAVAKYDTITIKVTMDDQPNAIAGALDTRDSGVHIQILPP